ncbi:alpha 1,2-mannosyltransferase 2.4.1 [Tulasnella sp. 424]|nr:alpha 1,2-mannosyltransferase 2.4.1 [Tulasnella sp. 424]
MLSPARYLLVVLLSLSFAESEFKNTTQRKANAAFVILARNSELNGVLQSIKMMEDRFNRNFGYPYVFLNEQPFTSDFIKWIFLYTSDIISTKAEYGVIPPEHWYQPEWIDEERAAKGRMALQQKETPPDVEVRLLLTHPVRTISRSIVRFRKLTPTSA